MTLSKKDYEEILCRNISTEKDFQYNLRVLKYNYETKCLTPTQTIASMKEATNKQREIITKKLIEISDPNLYSAF